MHDKFDLPPEENPGYDLVSSSFPRPIDQRYSNRLRAEKSAWIHTAIHLKLLCYTRRCGPVPLTTCQVLSLWPP